MVTFQPICFEVQTLRPFFFLSIPSDIQTEKQAHASVSHCKWDWIESFNSFIKYLKIYIRFQQSEAKKITNYTIVSRMCDAWLSKES